MIRRSALAALAAAACAVPALAQTDVTYRVDFFPEEPQHNHTSQLRFIGPSVGEVIETRLFITFTPLDGFNPADFTVVLFARTPESPLGGYWFLTGEDLGWTGPGPTYTATITTHDLDGALTAGLWGFELGSLGDPPAYSGEFGADSRFEVDIRLSPCVADSDGNGAIEPADVAAFVAMWFNDLNDGTRNADINFDYEVTPADIAMFVGLWFSGVGTDCP